MNKELKKLETIRSDAKEIFRSCLAAVDPYEAVKRFVRVEGDRLVVAMEGGPETELDLAEFDRISLVGAGKATAPMTDPTNTTRGPPRFFAVSKFLLITGNWDKSGEGFLTTFPKIQNKRRYS